MTTAKKQTITEARLEIERLSAELVEVGKQRDRLMRQVLDSAGRADEWRSIRGRVEHGGLAAILTFHESTLYGLELRVAKIGREAAEAELLEVVLKAASEPNAVNAADHFQRWQAEGRQA
jgi:hypothetical protein